MRTSVLPEFQVSRHPGLVTLEKAGVHRRDGCRTSCSCINLMLKGERASTTQTLQVIHIGMAIRMEMGCTVVMMKTAWKRRTR